MCVYCKASTMSMSNEEANEIIACFQAAAPGCHVTHDGYNLIVDTGGTTSPDRFSLKRCWNMLERGRGVNEVYFKLAAEERRKMMNKNDQGCEHPYIEQESYLNPCASAGCRLNGPVTYHLNCGSQHREFCLDCGDMTFDSADEEVETESVEYICSQCKQEGIQPGHYACGTSYNVPVAY